jgi:hypothetical protein
MMRLAPGKQFTPIQPIRSASSPLLQLQELFTVAGGTAVFGRKEPAFGAGFLGFRQCGIPLGANSAMRIVWFVDCLALGTSPLVPGFGHGLTPSSSVSGPQVSCQKLEPVALESKAAGSTLIGNSSVLPG